jgi:hypothetical protein
VAIETTSRGTSPEELPPEEEPVVTGTLFLMVLLLILIFGFWAMMYVTLINR